MLPITGLTGGNLPNHPTMAGRWACGSPPAKTYQYMEYAKSNLALAQNFQVNRADHTPERDRDDSQHPFGNQATARVACSRREAAWACYSCYMLTQPRCESMPPQSALGFASQPYGWFAFSRMMTLAGPFDTESASAHVGQASHLTVG